MGMRERLGSERGAVFVQVGIAVFVLVAFNVFVLDYGMVWVARRQAQNAADAGALAGAVARGYDDFDPTPSPTGTTARLAKSVAAANLIWNTPGVAVVPSFDCPAGVAGRCVRVDVYRNGEHGSPQLPTIFGPVLGVTSQGVRATATAVSANGNATNCLRPFAFADDWTNNRAPVDQFNRYSETGPSPGSLLPTPDTYATPGTTLSPDFGQRIDFEFDRNPQVDPITHGFLLSLNLGGTYADNITACSGQITALGQVISLATPAAGVTATGINDLIAQDSTANWNAGINKVENSCAPGCGAVSPRLIPVALFDPAEYQLRRATHNWTACPGNTPCVTVANIVAVFIHVGAAPNPHGHMVRYPGMKVSTAPTYVDNASWLATTTLIR